MPEQPKRQRKAAGDYTPFDGAGALACLVAEAGVVCAACHSTLPPALPTPSNPLPPPAPPISRPAVAERHTTPEGSEYVRVVLGAAGGAASEVDDPSAVIDAEFLFLAGAAWSILGGDVFFVFVVVEGRPAARLRLLACPRPPCSRRRPAATARPRPSPARPALVSLFRAAGDNIVNVRAASRAAPEGGGPLTGGRLALSLTDGLVVDRNAARRQLEGLRKALRWEQVRGGGADVAASALLCGCPHTPPVALQAAAACLQARRRPAPNLRRPSTALC